MVVKSADEYIFSPTRWEKGLSGLLTYVRQNSMYLREETIAALEQSESPQVIALTTCSSEFTDARTIVLAAMNPYCESSEEGQDG